MATTNEVRAQLAEFQDSFWHDWDHPPPTHVAHYTSLNSLRGIVAGKSFWASDIRFMNDTTEHSYAYDLVRRSLATRPDALSSEIDDNFQQHKGIPGFGVDWFRYAVCFCGVQDLLGQWRAYTPRGEGVALVTPFSALVPYAGHEFALIRVLYDSERQIEMVKRLMDEALRLWSDFQPRSQNDADNFLGIVGYTLIELMLRFKHPAFAEENEWRVLLITSAEENKKVLRYHRRDNKDIPHVEWAFRPEYLHEVMIGPGPYSADESITREILSTSGMGHVAITRSVIPLA